MSSPERLRSPYQAVPLHRLVTGSPVVQDERSAFLGFIPLSPPSARSPTTFDGCYEPRRVADAPHFRRTIYLFPPYDSGANAAGLAISTYCRQRVCSSHHHPFHADANVACGHWILPWQMAGHEPALPLPVSTGDSLRVHGPVLVDAFET